MRVSVFVADVRFIIVTQDQTSSDTVYSFSSSDSFRHVVINEEQAI